jgi:tetratricopeptide (TPR) repeat protein
MKKSMVLMAVLGMVLALSVPFVSARTSQDPSPEEAAAYKTWYEAVIAKDYVKVYQLSKEFVAKYPSSKNFEAVKKYIPGARGYLFNEARKAKNIPDELRLGKEALADDPNSLDYLYLMTIDIRANEMEASPANYSHAAEVADFSQRAISLLEAGKPSSVVKPENSKAALAYLYQTSAMVEAKNGNQDKAIEKYKKSSSIDPTNGILNAQNYLALGVIYQAKYGAAAKKFEALPKEKKEADPPDAEAKAALDDVNAQADQVIEHWGRFLALEDSKKYGATRDNVDKAHIDLWKFRHDDKLDGRDEYINKFKSGAASSSTPTSGAAATTKS